MSSDSAFKRNFYFPFPVYTINCFLLDIIFTNVYYLIKVWVHLFAFANSNLSGVMPSDSTLKEEVKASSFFIFFVF